MYLLLLLLINHVQLQLGHHLGLRHPLYVAFNSPVLRELKGILMTSVTMLNVWITRGTHTAFPGEEADQVPC